MTNSFNPFSLEGKKILITGASSGIGKQCAIDCAAMGATVILMGRSQERLEEVLLQINNSKSSYGVIDITDFDAVKAFLTNEVAKNGPFDGFIHSAGIDRTMPLRNVSSKDLQLVYETNVVAGVNILKLLTKKGSFKPNFKVVLIASITALIARVGTLSYTASKGALVAAVRELAVELAPKDINVNCISPGTVLTPLMQHVLEQMTEEEKEKRLSGFPLGIGKPEDISNACIYLLSDAARWITGQNLVVDGGYTAR